MYTLSYFTTTRVQLAALTLLLALGSTLACASGGCNRSDYRGVGCRAEAAREALVFGLSREEAIAAIGRTEVAPPWKNPLGLGPATISNPFDSDILTSPIGEEYEIVRFYVEATGNPDCPFIQGALQFEPLIFVEDKLVGWSWSYLAEVLGKRISPKKTSWDFGAFCGSPRTHPPATDPPEQSTPDKDPPAID
ncbi:MAG: hypothetical protein JRE38_07995 [Deltaproteobacteria bacterium]|nr:hypothetical protein [Deltaproteobacteria bacterium]MBW2577993.1 hypothetical protein [Deltaproteobacteria bacterium]MBW2694092.1 hypothetical protein [Deltaproteobacteria bacterium]